MSLVQLNPWIWTSVSPQEGAAVGPVRPHLPGRQVLHPTGHLVGAGHQILDGHVFHRHLVRVVAVLHARGPAGAQVFPQVALGGVLHDHIQRACPKGTRLIGLVARDVTAAMVLCYQGGGGFIRG